MDNKRLILIGILSFSLLMIWENWQRAHAPKPVQSASTAAGAQSSPLPVPTTQSGAAAITAPGVQTATPAAADYASAAKAVVKTDLLQVEVSALGGDVIRAELLQHKASGDSSQNFVLLEDKGKHTYLAQSGLLGNGLPNHKTLYQMQAGEYVLKEGQDKIELRLKAEPVNGVAVEKVLSFKRGSYVVDVSYELSNTSAAPVDAKAYYQFARDGKGAETTTGFMGGVTTFTGPAFYTDEKKFQKVAFSDIEKDKASFQKEAKDGWIAMVQHYFVAGYLPQGDLQREFFVRKLSEDFYSAGVMLPVSVAAGQKASISVPMYVGPQEQNKLKDLAPGFDLVVDYGWMTMIAVPLFWLLSVIHKFVGNWGWAIIILTIIVKAAFFPLSAASYRSMAKMKTLMPRMKQLQERYSNDKMKMNQELMELYKREKVNPMGGCLPILVQIPVFMALYWVLLGVVEMRQAPWILWITDLSVKDPYYVLPIIMGVSMLIQTKLNPAPPDPMQAKVMMAMPFIFTVMFLWFPSGLVLYWVVNNVLSIAQQWYITRQIESGADTAKA